MKIKILSVAVLCAALVLVCCGQARECARRRGLSLYFPSVGDNGCVLIQMDGVTVLADPPEGYLQTWENIGRIDYLVLSVLSDNILGGAGEILSMHDIGQILLPGYRCNSGKYSSFMDAANEKNTPVRIADGDVSISSENGTLKVIPTRGGPYRDEDNYSFMCSLTYGNFGFLYAADAMSARCREFLRGAEAVRYTLIKIPHTEAMSAGAEELIDAFDYRYAVICASSRENTDKRFTEKLGKNGVEVYGTYSGGVSFICRDGEVRVGYVRQ
ncbi:MAG: ComEC/Rec2 family competence protein [Eubacteriales bacterium]